MADPATNPEWVLWIGGVIGTGLAAFIARMGWKSAEPGKAASKAEAVIAGVGMAFGSTEQGERLIKAVQGVEAAIRDKKQDEVQDTMQDLLEELRRREGR